MDPDGKHILNLLLTCLWYLCPELVINGHVYIAYPPLFRITTKKNEYIFLKGKKELEEYKEQHQEEKFLINRNKGLGEQDASELEECLLNPATRNVEQVIVNSEQEVEEILEMLLGDTVAPRREFILNHSEEARV